MFFMNSNILQNFETKMSPTIFDYFTSIFLMVFGLIFLVWLIININSYNYYLFIFNLIVFVILPIVFSIPVMFTQKIYINYEQKYIRIDTRIIPFSDIDNFNYKHSFTHLKNPLAVIFVLNLKTGEQVKFSCYFKGSDLRVCEMLKKAELIYNNSI